MVRSIVGVSVVASQNTSRSAFRCARQEANVDLAEMLDRILNDPAEPLDAEKVWSISEKLANNGRDEIG